ncbi:MAG TPA: transposase, partial [Planctomycetes bacterium]|nr:transposase [Planctomycetota bacterium]
MTDRTEDGRQLRLLAVIDEYTRECLAIEVARSFTAQDVLGVLQYLFAVRGTPQHIRSDNGPEFVAAVIRDWLRRSDVGPLFIAKGSPWENGYVESFNGKLHDELLNRELFLSMEEARWVIDR